MSISITINANDALDLQRQIRTLLNPDLAEAVDVAATAETAELGDIRTTKRPGRPKNTPAPVKPVPEADPMEGIAPGPADPAKQRAEAVSLLRSVYSKGKPGEDAVSAVCAQFGVSKLVDVPLAKAGELLTAAAAAHVAIVGPVPA